MAAIAWSGRTEDPAFIPVRFAAESELCTATPMPKTDRNLAELKRQVRLLLALDGRALRLADGLWLVRHGRLRDVHALRALLPRPGVARNELKACFTEGTHCEPLSRQHLAAATHALAVLHVHEDELEDTPARWLGGQRRDRAWLAAQRGRVQRLSAWLGAPTNGAALADWFDGAALPPLDARGEALAWLCDTPPTRTPELAGCDDGVFAQVLSRIATHGPRDSDQAAALIAATAGWPGNALDAWWPWLVRGVDPREVECWPPASRARAAPPGDWPMDAVGIYLRLTAALLRTPGGGRLNLVPSQFARLASGRRTTLLALASALDQVLAGDAGTVEQTLALADSALRLDGRLQLPQAAPLRAGIGNAADPGFTEWLGDDALVDRYLSLREALGEPVEISRRLHQDFAATQRGEVERTFLAALPADDPRRARLARPAANDPARTRRRIAAECTQLELRWRMAQADRALRDTLARALGAASPRWDEAWRDAARLYLAVDQNHAELKGLLRAAAAGDAPAWRLRLTGNAAWLARAAAHIDTQAWLDPPAHSFPWRGSICTLAAERDPLQALRMGLPFDSCLAIDAGCNRHSAIINALDANKWVVYLRDPRGRILARQLVAISSDWRLVGYRVYTSIGTGEGLIDAFADYARALAARCGIEPADHGQPETLNGRDWYDDGTLPWRPSDAGEAARQVADYLAGLGMDALDIPGLNLANEARRHALARAGHVAALPDWYDARPSGLRNLALLQARYGRNGLLRLLGDPQRRDRYRFEPLREAPLSELLKLRRQLQDPARVGFGRDLGDNPVDDAAIRHALRELLAEPPDARFDDDSFEHALLTLLPRWVETLPFAALAARLPLLARAWDRLASGLPADCADCVRSSEDWLLRALRGAWRQDPDPPRMLRLLQARHTGDRLPHWLLALASREHLSAPAALPLFAPPQPDRSVQRALAALVARHPALRSHPLQLAARLRHSSPDELDIGSIEWPEAPPWDALGDAICDWPALWPALRRYARRPGDLSPCGAVEAHWARQVATAWRAALPASVAALDDESPAAARILGDIGDAGLIDEARKLLRRHAHRARGERKRAHEAQAVLNAADGAGTLGAMQRAWRSLDESTDEAELTLLAAHPEARSLTDALIEHPQPPVWARAWLQRQLPGCFDAQRCLRLWQHPQWRELALLAAPQAWSASHARRLLQRWPQDLGEQWLAQALQSGNTDLLDDGDLEWFRRLARLAAANCSDEQRRALFQALPDALAASVWLSAAPE